MVADAGPATLGGDAALPELPTAATRADDLRVAAEGLLARVKALPLERVVGEAEATVVAVRELVAGDEMRTVLATLVATAADLRALATGPELRSAIAGLGGVTAEAEALARRLDARAAPVLDNLEQAARAAAGSADRAGRLVAGLDGTIGPRAPLWANVESLLRELTGTVRALRLLVEYLERRPDALVRGRSAGAP
jgi:paraquat-inducible protein B